MLHNRIDHAIKVAQLLAILCNDILKPVKFQFPYNQFIIFIHVRLISCNRILHVMQLFHILPVIFFNSLCVVNYLFCCFMVHLCELNADLFKLLVYLI
jgi:hypothetical protein